jgi:hypothetical protein
MVPGGKWKPTSLFDISILQTLYGHLKHCLICRTSLEKKYGTFTEAERLEMLEETRKMFYHG